MSDPESLYSDAAFCTVHRLWTCNDATPSSVFLPATGYGPARLEVGEFSAVSFSVPLTSRGIHIAKTRIIVPRKIVRLIRLGLPIVKAGIFPRQS